MKTQEITTTDFAQFGYAEKKEAKELLSAWIEQGLPKDFYDHEVTIMMNRNSGHVFLTNSEYQVAMLNDDKLESWYTCWNCGNEGFAEDIKLDEENHKCDRCA